MLTNATLTRIDLPGTPDVTGAVAYTPGAAISVAVFVGEPTRGQRIALEGRIAEASAVVYLPQDEVETPPPPRARLAVVLDAEPGLSVVREVIEVRSNFKAGGLSHHAVFVREVAE